MSLANRAIRASGWQLLTVVIQSVLHYGAMFFMARCVAPENWSVITVTMIAVDLAKTFSNAGLGPALVQRPEITTLHKRVALTASILIGVCMMAAVFASAPAIARYYELPQLRQTLRVMSFSFVLQSFGLISKSLLTRALDFRRIMWIQLIAYSCGYAFIGITLAILGFESWAIILATLSHTTIASVLYFVSARHSLKPSLNWSTLKELMAFGGGLTLSRVFHFAGANIDKIILAKVLGNQVLGVYDMAFRLMMLPAKNIGKVIDQVMFPVLASAQHDLAILRKGFLGVIGVISVLYLPLTVFVIVVAEQLTISLLGMKWVAVILPLQLLMVSSYFRVSIRMCDATVRSIGAMYQSAVRKMFFVAAIALGAWLGGTSGGISGACIGLGIANAVTFLIMSMLCCRLVELKASVFLWKNFSGVPLAVMTGLVSVLALHFVQRVTASPVIALLSTTLAVTTTVAAAVWVRPALLGESGLLLLQKTLRMIGASHPILATLRHHFTAPVQ